MWSTAGCVYGVSWNNRFTWIWPRELSEQLIVSVALHSTSRLCETLLVCVFTCVYSAKDVASTGRSCSVYCTFLYHGWIDDHIRSDLVTTNKRCLWPPYVIGQVMCIFILSFVLYSSFAFIPNLSRRRLDVYHTCTHGVALVRI